MPYILVETTTPTGGKELLAAPAAWIQKKADGTAYLCWPFARSIRKLNTLFQDEYSIPSEVWERLECEILC
ncbi:AGAP011071-PA, partial [Anopheles gambiae str. PEST]